MWKTYPDKLPDWLTDRLGQVVWHADREFPKVYLTFDDGPTPGVTDRVLDLLAKYNFTATFFCLGKNVKQNPDLFSRILEGGHAVGNHTFDHLDGWQTPVSDYVKNVEKAAKWIETPLFRPPYGHIRPSQVKSLQKMGFQVIMWDVLSGDFDERSPASILTNLKRNVSAGSIVVFHDSKKAANRLMEVLPQFLDFVKHSGLSPERLSS